MNRQEQIKLFRRHLREIERAVSGSLKDQTTCCGVTLAQCHVLLELEEMGSPSIVELAEKLKLDASTLSRTIDGLVKSGWVSRTENPRNRRSSLISLTQEGRKTCDEINERCNQFYSRVFARIPAAQHAKLLDAVELLSGVFCEFRFDACCGGSSKGQCENEGKRHGKTRK
jgi:DNA-binding MarR family transcriptional regulator